MTLNTHAASRYRAIATAMCTFVLLGMATPAKTSQAEPDAPEVVYSVAGAETARRAAADSCKTEQAIREQLLSYGFENVHLGANVSQMNMQADVRFRGEQYVLLLDRCNARLLSATALSPNENVLSASLR